MAPRRPVLACLLATAFLALYGRNASFVGSPAPGCQRGGREVARVNTEYSERCGPTDADAAFDTSSAVGTSPIIYYKKHPFDILRYKPGNGMKGAMAMEVNPVSRYPGDPPGPDVRRGRVRRHDGAVHRRRGGAHRLLREGG